MQMQDSVPVGAERVTNFKDRLDVIEHLISIRNIHADDRDLFMLILEELRVLRGKTDEAQRLIKAVREGTR